MGLQGTLSIRLGAQYLLGNLLKAATSQLYIIYLEMLVKKFLVGLMMVLTLSACTGRSSVPIDGQWKLVSYNQTPALPNVETTMEFKDGQLSGSVGCNHFGGEYKVKDDIIEFGPIMTTEMFCEAVADQEAGTYGVLQGKASFVLDGDTLTITSEDGIMFVVLARK